MTRRTAAVYLATFGALCIEHISRSLAQAPDPFGSDQTLDSTIFEGAAACSQVSESVCGSANTSFLLMAGGYLVLGLVIFVSLHMWWKARGAHDQGLKFAVPLALGAAAVGALVGLDPLATETYVCCTADPVYRATILLGDNPTARGVAMGAVPFALLYVLLARVFTALRNRRRS